MTPKHRCFSVRQALATGFGQPEHGEDADEVDRCEIDRDLAEPAQRRGQAVATSAVELEIDKVHVANASRDMRTQTEHHVLCRFDSGNLNRRDVDSRDRSFERLLGDFPRFERNKASAKSSAQLPEGRSALIVLPTAHC
jgi:hypothetical protein